MPSNLLFNFASAVLLLTAFPNIVSAHCSIRPALGWPLGVAPLRADIHHLNLTYPCGMNVTSDLIANTIPVYADKDNKFNVTNTNFNGGADGATEINYTYIDPTGTGNGFKNTTKGVVMIKNGVYAPRRSESDLLIAQLPSGTVCTGGTDGQSCLVGMETNASFGNCVLVSQAKANTNGTNLIAAANVFYDFYATAVDPRTVQDNFVRTMHATTVTVTVNASAAAVTGTASTSAIDSSSVSATMSSATTSSTASSVVPHLKAIDPFSVSTTTSSSTYQLASPTDVGSDAMASSTMDGSGSCRPKNSHYQYHRHHQKRAIHAHAGDKSSSLSGTLKIRKHRSAGIH